MASKSDISLNDLKAMLPQEGEPAERRQHAALSSFPRKDRDLPGRCAGVSFRLTTLEQFPREFPANTEYFILEHNISKVEDVGWRYLAQHLDILLPPELLDAVDPVPSATMPCGKNRGALRARISPTLSGDEWEHERPKEKQTEKSPPIKERLGKPEKSWYI